MKTNEGTELVFILDKSGSMGGLESDTIGGFNALLAKQKKQQGEVKVTTVLFSNDYELLHDRLPIEEITPITENEYEVGGTTALLDAIGATINNFSNAQKRTSEEQRAQKVMFVITTDGMENASCEFTRQTVKSMISRQKEQEQWEFVFLGANIDAVKTAGSFGIDEEFSVNYHADEAGIELNYKVLSDTVTLFRKGKKVERSWKQGIEADFRKRK